jgi:hypothetical protein
VLSILDWVRSALDAGLDSYLMNQLNFIDLQAMIIEYRIREKQAEIERLNNEKRNKSGNSFREASPDDIDRL